MRTRPILLATSFVWMAAFVDPLIGSQETSAELLRLWKDGQWEKAEKLLRDAEPDDALSSRISIDLLLRRGKRQEARGIAGRLYGRYQMGALQSAEDRVQAGYAAWVLQDWESANSIFIEVSKTPPVPRSLYVDWGHLYLEKYDPGEAEVIFREGLALEGDAGGTPRESSDLYLGIAKALKGLGNPGISEALAAAREADGRNPAVVAFEILLSLDDEDLAEAEEKTQQALEDFPGFLPLIELRCATAHFKGDSEPLDKCVRELNRINPADGQYYELLGDLSVKRRRLEEAVDHYSRAFELDPGLWRALGSKGINLLRLGRESEGIAALEEAYANDPYNIWTVNTLRLVDSFERFERFENERFTIRLHRDEADVLRPYVETLLERSLDSLESRYSHHVDHRVVFEMFPDHEDFAVRTLGLPGLGALGATFGRVVAMDSPNARPKGEFHWGSTLWHEMAHVVTLSLSKSEIPRWFTEGLSMLEERRGGAGWGDPLTPSFVQAYVDGKLLPLKDLNSGFVRPDSPEQIANSYFQAGWLCEMLARDFGVESLRRMVALYGDGKETAEVFEEVLDLSIEEVDQRFRAELARVLDPLRKVLERPEGPIKGETELRVALAGQPENFHLNLALGVLLMGEGKSAEAQPFLEKAIEVFPYAVDAEGPYGLLLKIYLEREDKQAATSLLARWWELSPLLVENALRLSELLAGEGRREEGLQVLEQALYSNPFSLALHKRLGELYLVERRSEEAVREFRVLLALKPQDEADARYQYARALFSNGSREEARHQALLSLEIAPGFEEAQALLLEIVRP